MRYLQLQLEGRDQEAQELAEAHYSAVNVGARVALGY